MEPLTMIADLSGGRDPAFDDEQRRLKNGIYRKDLRASEKDAPKFAYFYMRDDRPISAADKRRVSALNLPPAYEDVWISLDPHSRIQATAYDAKGRKQYRYHADHMREAARDKFLRLREFVRVLPKLDAKLKRDLTAPPFSKERSTAALVLAMRVLNLRVGKETYVHQNASYGATSLRKKHLRLLPDRQRALLRFKSKSNHVVAYNVRDPRLVAELTLLAKLDGDRLFQFKNEAGRLQRVTDRDVNLYLQEAMGSFVAKDFRTYAANLEYVRALLAEVRRGTPRTGKEALYALGKAQNTTAQALRHTKAISRKSYTLEYIRERFLADASWFAKQETAEGALRQLLEDFAAAQPK